MSVNLILDSGAYSCWKQGKSIDVHKYGEFLLKNEQYIWRAVNLDKIPGEFGRVPSPDEVEASAKEGFKNSNILRDMGVNAMPVFHMGERMYWLEKMVDEGFDYIGISPANDRTTKQKRVWLDEVFGLLCGKGGFPAVKTHGFGVTALPLLARYPWYSADSVTWMLVGGYGNILVPSYDKHGEPDYTQPPIVLGVSTRSTETAADNKSQPHYMMLNKELKVLIDNYLDKGGFTIEDLGTDYGLRQQVCARFFKLAAQTYKRKPFENPSPGLFGSRDLGYGTSKDPFEHFRFIFSITNSQEMSDALNRENIEDRLATYYYFYTGDGFSLDAYTSNGQIIKDAKPKKPKKAPAQAKGQRKVSKAKPKATSNAATRRQSRFKSLGKKRRR